ncbi:hypothetical protein ACFDR9_002668 [Janthinobacterium sp. CG_23.3]|uniref:hypothetical protein n=1 Tax=unclassified Janthinobacterium TaxID=2610881 RepID=UPI00034B12BF|nr:MULTISPECIES: hypothetical protein [unclassified Janthinobacterium]MEC5160424.1 hypothetical protein [Janthinobacterium sp. CG_S6]
MTTQTNIGTGGGDGGVARRAHSTPEPEIPPPDKDPEHSPVPEEDPIPEPVPVKEPTPPQAPIKAW